jgi:hypothetical protein
MLIPPNMVGFVMIIHHSGWKCRDELAMGQCWWRATIGEGGDLKALGGGQGGQVGQQKCEFVVGHLGERRRFFNGGLS